MVELLLPPELLAKWRKFSSSKTPLDQVQNRIRLEYSSLFLLPTSQRITLRESSFFHLPLKSEKAQRRIESLLKYYRRIGLTPMAKFKDQPDHLSQVMHFMSVLCDREKDYLEKKNHPQLETTCQIQTDFVPRHLEKWIPEFRERMHRSSRFMFFRDMADTLSDFLNAEVQWVPGLLKRYGFRRPRKAHPGQPRPPDEKPGEERGPSDKPFSKRREPRQAVQGVPGSEQRRRPRRRKRRRRPGQSEKAPS